MQVQVAIALSVRVNIANYHKGGFFIMPECNCCTNSSNVACNIGAFNSEERSRYDVLRTELTKNLEFYLA